MIKILFYDNLFENEFEILSRVNGKWKLNIGESK
jgi:hypothetical protein